MIKIKYSVFLLLLMNIYFVNAQNIVENFEMPSQSFIKFNRSILNPTFSVLSSNKKEITLFNRNQWSEIGDSPKTYLLSFTGNTENKNGYGICVFQKTAGIWKNFGGVLNYSKGINLSEENIFSAGFNLIAYNSGLNRGKIIIGEADPLLEQYENTNVVMINPGLSLKLSQFNIGVYADNLFDYNFNLKKMQTSFSDKTYSGHLMYSSNKSEASNVFENSVFTLMTTAKYKKNSDLEYTGGAMYNVPKAGWIQAGYNSFYGIFFGGGINISTKFALGYDYEKGTKDLITNLGATHEIYVSWYFDTDDYSSQKEAKKQELEKKTLEQEEIERFKKNVYSKEIVEDNPSSKTKTENFVKVAEEENINYLLLPEKNGVIKKGYYIISNVYGNKSRATKKLNELKQSGLGKSGIFTTISGQLNYVYLERYDKLEDAKKAYFLNYNKKNKEIIWLLPIL